MNKEIEEAYQVLETLRTDGYKILKQQMEILLQSLIEQLILYRGADNDKDDFLKGEIQGIKDCLELSDKYKDIIKETEK